jgi:hypothetical protein
LINQSYNNNSAIRLSSRVKVILLFLVQPFVLLIVALKNYKTDWAKNAVWMFTVFYGLTFAISPDSSADAVVYALRLSEMHNMNWSLVTVLSQLYVVDGFTDIYQPLLTFLVSRFTDNYNILFGFFGLVLGYFYSRNIWFLVERSGYKLNLYGILLIAVFAFIVSISSGINGVRFWTAAHIFIFGCFRYLFDDKQCGILIAASAILVHFAYIVPSLLLLGYIFVGNRLVIYYMIFVLSYFITELDFETGRYLASFLPEVFREAGSGAYSEIVERRIQTGGGIERPWFIQLNSILFPTAIFILVSY